MTQGANFTVGSLFSGIGGFDLGLERAGMTVRWQCEIDGAAQSVLRKHFPDAVLYDDVITLGGTVERVDLICGGFPCQDLSVAGRRAGLAGSRSGLFYEFMRIANKLAPAWVLIENVPGLLSSNDGRDMGAVLGTLGELGYGWAYRVLDAQYFGVAQRRRRVFIVGCLGDRSGAAQVLFEPESLPGNPPPSREAGARVTQSLTGGPGSSSCGNPDDNRAQGGFVVPSVAPVLTANYGKQPDNSDTNAGPCLVASTLKAHHYGQDPEMNFLPVATTHALTARHDSSEDGCGRGTPLTVATLVSNGDAHSGFRNGEGCIAFSAGNSADAYGIALTEEGTPPLKSADSGLNQVPTVQYGMAVRRLTPVECERLQAFPDGWTASGALSVRLIGYTDEDSLRRLIRWHGINAQSRDAIGRLLTGSMESASCITSDSRNTELLISRNASNGMDSNAKSASVWWEARVPEDCVQGTISPGSDTVTLCDQRLIKFAAPKITSGHTLLSLLPVLAESSAPGSSSITSTWTDEITNLLTSMFSPTLPVICEPTTRSIDWSSDSSKRALFALRMVNTANQSDSARYRQLGNAVCVNVAEWVGRRIMAVAP